MKLTTHSSLSKSSAGSSGRGFRLTLAVTVVLALPAFPNSQHDSFGAIAIGEDAGRLYFGLSFAADTQAEADDGALELCDGPCSIQFRYWNQCVALATDRDSFVAKQSLFGWAWAPDELAAMEKATDRCIEEGGTACVVEDSACSPGGAGAEAGQSGVSRLASADIRAASGSPASVDRPLSPSVPGTENPDEQLGFCGIPLSEAVIMIEREANAADVWWNAFGPQGTYRAAPSVEELGRFHDGASSITPLDEPHCEFEWVFSYDRVSGRTTVQSFVRVYRLGRRVEEGERNAQREYADGARSWLHQLPYGGSRP